MGVCWHQVFTCAPHQLQNKCLPICGVHIARCAFSGWITHKANTLKRQSNKRPVTEDVFLNCTYHSQQKPQYKFYKLHILGDASCSILKTSIGHGAPYLLYLCVWWMGLESRVAVSNTWMSVIVFKLHFSFPGFHRGAYGTEPKQIYRAEFY